MIIITLCLCVLCWTGGYFMGVFKTLAEWKRALEIDKEDK